MNLTPNMTVHHADIKYCPLTQWQVISNNLARHIEKNARMGFKIRMHTCINQVFDRAEVSINNVARGRII